MNIDVRGMSPLLQVFDMPVSLHFYRDVIGFEIVSTSGGGDNSDLFFSCRELDEVYEHLKGHGVKLAPPKTAPYGMRQLYANDPDGYVLCFQWPSKDEAGSQWNKYYGDQL